MRKLTHRLLRAASVVGVVLALTTAAVAGVKEIQPRSAPQSANTADTTVYAAPRGVSTFSAAQAQQSTSADEAGQIALADGELGVAEIAFRRATEINASNSTAISGLARTLEMEGKNKESIKVYRYLLYPKYGWGTSIESDPVLRMHFALLLARDGQWAEAVSIYDNTLGGLSLGPPFPILNIRFNPDVSSFSLFQAMVHLRLGILHSGRLEQNQAYAEYQAAHDLQPDVAITNYYFGYGWQKLSPVERAKSGDAAQAKAALEKAVKLGKPDVKEAAQKALIVAAKP